MEKENVRREYPLVPLVAVGVLLIEKKTKSVLLIRRGNPPGKGKYSIPGGLVEIGEKLIDAAKREVREEVSIECEIVGIISVEEIIIKDKRGLTQWHYVLIDFLGEPRSIKIKPSSDAQEARWFHIEEAMKLDLTDATRRLLLKIRKYLLGEESDLMMIRI